MLPEVRILVILGMSVSGYPKRGAGPGADGSLGLPLCFLIWVLVTQVCALCKLITLCFPLDGSCTPTNS